MEKEARDVTDKENIAEPDYITVNIAEDQMKAYLCVRPPVGEKKYTVNELLQAILQAGVIYGVDRKRVEALLQEEKYNKEVCVAEGKEAVDGVDGSFEMQFETERPTGPRILQDGSVDYSAYGDMQIIKEGEVLAIYHLAVSGEEGMTVTGKHLLQKPGRNLSRLKTKNVTVSSDGCTYTAAIDGLISYQPNDNKLTVKDVLVVESDVSVNTGNISFVGDVHIRGNVLTGMLVKSEKGGIIVDGYVEGATLVARKDIVLKNGMQGNGKGKVVSNGAVSGKFFEQSMIDAQGTVNANSIMNCDVNSGEDIIVSGKLGIIIGGHISAMRRIEATIIGNMAEVGTSVWAGIAGDLLTMLSQAEKQITETETELAKLTKGVEQIDTILEAGPPKEKEKAVREKRLEIIRAKVERDAKLIEQKKKREEILANMEKANAAKVIIKRSVFPGTKITINGVSTMVTEIFNGVEYYRRGAGIIVGNIE